MSHNISLTYGGYTPSMAVFGVLPRSLYEFETDQITAVQGAADKDLTVFERAIRLRQIALAAVQQAVSEDRLARASHTKAKIVDTTDLVPGATEVEIYRDASWRAPATLLEVDTDEGTAIVKHQGRPYLMPIRFIRKYQGTFYALDTDSGESLYSLMRFVESWQQYKQGFLGYKLSVTPTGRTWITVPKEVNA